MHPQTNSKESCLTNKNKWAIGIVQGLELTFPAIVYVLYIIPSTHINKKCVKEIVEMQIQNYVVRSYVGLIKFQRICNADSLAHYYIS